MKLSSVLLISSLAVNTALLAAFFLTPSHRQPIAGPTQSAKSNFTEITKTSNTHQTLWHRLACDDIDQFKARLRSAGFPSKIARLIAIDLLDKKTDAARTEIMGRREDVPYWKNNNYMPEDLAQREKLEKLFQEQLKTYRSVGFNSEALAEDDELAARVRRKFGDFSIEKLQRLSKIDDDYSEMQQEIYNRFTRSKAKEPTTEDRAKLKLLRTEQQRDIQQSLTPEEYAQYQLHAGPTASRLRYQLEIFRPTEAEYLKLFSLQHSLDDRFDSDNSDDQTAYRQALDNLKPQIEAALGSERYADYIQATEHGSDKLNRLMVRLDLPLSTSGKISEVRQNVTQRADTIRNDAQLDPAARAAQLASLAQEARTQLTTTLGGDRGYQAYNDMKGDWLRALQPKQP